jgi:hypothetical protein
MQVAIRFQIQEVIFKIESYVKPLQKAVADNSIYPFGVHHAKFDLS